MDVCDLRVREGQGKGGKGGGGLRPIKGSKQMSCAAICCKWCVSSVGLPQQPCAFLASRATALHMHCLPICCNCRPRAGSMGGSRQPMAISIVPFGALSLQSLIGEGELCGSVQARTRMHACVRAWLGGGWTCVGCRRGWATAGPHRCSERLCT